MSAAGTIPFLLRAFVSSCESNLARTKTQRHEEGVLR